MKRFLEVIWTKEDRATVAEMYKTIKQLRNDTTRVPNGKRTNTNHIKQLRINIKEYQQTFFGFKMQHGKESVIIPWQYTRITARDIKEARDAKFRSIRRERAKLKEMNIRSVNHLGYAYDVIGGVLTKPNVFKELVGTVDASLRLAAEKTPLTFDKANYVGVELECIVKCSKVTLRKALVEAKLERHCQIKDDGSIRDIGDGEIGIEVVLMAKENEVADVVSKLCAVLQGANIRARANHTCGMHVHIDMRQRDVAASYSKLYKALPIMMLMVSEERRSGRSATRYCKRNKESQFLSQVELGDRYYVLNADAYRKYKTLEVRSHGGTVNALKINNWIKLLTTIVNAPALLTAKGTPRKQSFKTLSGFSKGYNITGALKDYVKERIDLFSNESVTESNYEPTVAA